MKTVLRTMICCSICLLLIACTKMSASNNDKVKKEYTDVSVELIQRYWPSNVPPNHGDFSFMSVLESNDIVYRLTESNSDYSEHYSSIRILNKDLVTEKTVVEDSDSYWIVNINNNIVLTSQKEKKEYIITDFDTIKQRMATTRFKISKNYELNVDGKNFKIVANKKLILGNIGTRCILLPFKIYSDIKGRVYCMFIYDSNVGRYIIDRTVLKIENDNIEDKIFRVCDYTFIPNCFICINKYQPKEVPRIEWQEKDDWEDERSINVFDTDGNVIKNLDKELYEKYNLIAYPSCISVNSNGYGAMKGSFTFNYGKENEENFFGMIIFKLVENQ